MVEILQDDGDLPRKVNAYVYAQYPHSWGQGALKTGYQGHYNLKSAFVGKFHETKVVEHP